jgi:four helix bundle protein
MRRYMKQSPTKTKSYVLAIKIVELYKRLAEQRREYVISKQVLKSGTSVGANIREAIYAESKADFIHKMCIALKESSETEYWLELLRDTKYIDGSTFDSLHSDCEEVTKLLTAIIKSARKDM